MEVTLGIYSINNYVNSQSKFNRVKDAGLSMRNEAGVSVGKQKNKWELKKDTQKNMVIIPE